MKKPAHSWTGFFDHGAEEPEEVLAFPIEMQVRRLTFPQPSDCYPCSYCTGVSGGGTGVSGGGTGVSGGSSVSVGGSGSVPVG